MKRKYSYIILLLTGWLALGSCQKYLDVKPSTLAVTPTTISDLQALLDDGLNMNQTRTPNFGEATTDDFFMLDDIYDQLPDRDMFSYRFDPYLLTVFTNDWSYAYTPIYTANYALEQLDKTPPTTTTQTAWNNVKGSALFFRAYYFSQIAWTFSLAYDSSTAGTDLGIALRLGSDFNQPSVRTSVQQTYERIVSDAKESLAYLPLLPTHPYRPSRTAANGLLARVYLSMRVYDSAYKYANLALQGNSQLINYNGDADITGSFSGSNTPFKAYNKETIFYTEETVSYTAATEYVANIDSLLYRSYAANDLRKTGFFTLNTSYPASNNYQLFKGTYSRTFGYLFSGIATDELYLIRAECAARKNDITGAMSDLNTLCAKRYNATFVPYTASSASDALTKVLTERRKELLMRGLRFIDLKRLNKEGANITIKRIVHGQNYTLPPNDKRYALPLPKDVIDQSGMPQNPY